MSIVRPFAGLRPPADKVLKVVAPPYDVVNTEEARAYAKGNALSFFHVSRPEIDLPPGTDSHADEVYALGHENFVKFQKEGVLVADPAPCFYLYRQKMGEHVQTGLVAAASVEEYQKGLIKKHELTRADKEDDRTRHIDELNANDEPVFLTYRARPGIDAFVKRYTAEHEPTYDFTTEDGIVHTFWVVNHLDDIAALDKEFRALEEMYIADGHHRSAAAGRVQAERAKKTAHSGNEEYNFFLAVIFPHNQMQILDYNRVVKDLNGLSSDAFLKKVAEKFEISPGTDAKPKELHTFGLLLDGKWHLLRAKPGTFDAADPVANLDVSILQENLLAPILGIKDPRTDKRIDFVGGIRGTKELERLVNEGKAKVAISMHPTKIEQMMAIADAGKIMPPKSTWFEPKLRSGIVVHAF